MRVALGLGGNLGDPLSGFRTVARVFSRHLHPLRTASLYRGDAVSPIPQPPYLNTVIAGLATALPEDLLAIAKSLERAAGRASGLRDSPRPLDVDLLVYGDLMRRAPELELPHPRLRRRRFVLEPLAEIAPDWELPPDGRTPRALLAELAGEPPLERLGPWSWS